MSIPSALTWTQLRCGYCFESKLWITSGTLRLIFVFHFKRICKAKKNHANIKECYNHYIQQSPATPTKMHIMNYYISWNIRLIIYYYYNIWNISIYEHECQIKMLRYRWACTVRVSNRMHVVSMPIVVIVTAVLLGPLEQYHPIWSSFGVIICWYYYYCCNVFGMSGNYYL